MLCICFLSVSVGTLFKVKAMAWLSLTVGMLWYVVFGISVLLSKAVDVKGPLLYYVNVSNSVSHVS